MSLGEVGGSRKVVWMEWAELRPGGLYIFSLFIQNISLSFFLQIPRD